MAKGNLFLSQARGKVGSVVFSRVDGQQVTRVYTDNVKNPRSEAQNLQRAIFYSVQRMAAGAKYLVEQGQEGVATGYKSRRAFVKKALNDLRTAVLNGQPNTLNVKGNPYMQAIPVSLTNGSLQAPSYNYVEIEGTDNFLPSTVGNVTYSDEMTLSQLFAAVPSLGLGKQLTMVWLTVTDTFDDDAVEIAELNYKTKLNWAEVVFAADENVLNLPAFAIDDESGELTFNHEVLAPSWGGTAKFPGVSRSGRNWLTELPIDTLAFAYIVSDYTNNRWSRSYSPLAINPRYITDPYLVAATYANDEAAKGSDLYLDQGESSYGTSEENPRIVEGNVGGLGGTGWNLTNNLAKTISVPVSQGTQIDVAVYPKKTSYTEDSVAVSFDGSADSFAPSGAVVLVPTSYGDAWTCDFQPTTAPTAGQSTIMQLKVGTITRTLTINWVAG